MGHSILNIEGISALIFLLVVLLRARTLAPELQPEMSGRERRILFAIAFAAFAPFARALFFPLLHDSYDLVYMANVQSWNEVLHLFYARAETRDYFYRPVAFTLFWLYAKLAHYHPLPWHAFCVAGHVVNSVLVYVLARRLRLAQVSAACAALVFAWHGSRPEAVAWVATRVDILATLFALIALLNGLRYLDTSRMSALILTLTATACAVLSKESAYTLPLLFLTLLVFREDRRRALPTTAAMTAVCATLFLCRFFILGSIGGYHTLNGAPTALNLNPLRTSNALLYRQWAIAFFPINWSEKDALIWIGLSAGGLAMLAAMTAQPVNRKLLAAALAFTILAVLPAQSLLLIGADLNNARVLYLPAIGVALLWGVILQSQSSKARQITIMASLLVFQLCALTHNLNIWRYVAGASQRACVSMAQELVRDPSPISVDPLPAKWKGVFFLHNGFAPCLMMNSGGKLTGPPEIVQGFREHTRHYRWDEASQRMQRVP